MIKKIGALALLIGGVLGAIGGISAFAMIYSIDTRAESAKNSLSEAFALLSSLEGEAKKIANMAVLARVGAIILLIASIAVVAGVFMEGSKKNAVISYIVVGIAAFVGQFMINPITNAESTLNWLVSDTSDNVVKGLIFIGVCGVILAINGLIILFSRKKNINFVG